LTRRTSPSPIEIRRRGWFAAALALCLIAPPAAAQGVPEPPDYQLEDYRSPTPQTLAGARVVTSQEAYKLWQNGAIFIDVMPRPIKPPDLPNDTLWRELKRETIPGSTWLPNVGYGKLTPEMDGYFRLSLYALSGGDRAKPLLFFCMADCWMSWNAARRALVEYGYTQVIWYPQGVDGWHFPDAPFVKIDPRP
jgi:PQQ-dependent catabolism-associated CXXCW motif protein